MGTKIPVLCSNKTCSFLFILQGFLIFLLHCVRNSEVRKKSFLFKNAISQFFFLTKLPLQKKSTAQQISFK